MKLLDHLTEIDQCVEDVYIIHEKFERKFNKHAHLKGQLSFVEDGVAYLSLENQNYIVPAKHFFWIPPGIEHQLKVSHSAAQLHSFYVQDLKDSFFDNFGIYPASNLIIELIKFSERWNQQYLYFDAPFAQAMRTLFAVITLQKASIEIKQPIATNDFMEKITHFIINQYSQPLTLKDMTLQFNMSERSFCRLFKKELNTTFLQYLKTVRVIKAIEFLAKTDKSVYEIANAVGYESISAFSSIFLDYTGKRPQEMRLLLKK